MLWLVRSPSFARLLAVELWLSCIFGSYNESMVVFLTEVMPVNVRTSGFSLAYSLATVLRPPSAFISFMPPVTSRFPVYGFRLRQHVDWERHFWPSLSPSPMKLSGRGVFRGSKDKLMLFSASSRSIR